MKCRVCRGGAVIEVRRHNAAFCRDHFLHHCREQVRKAVDGRKMFGPDASVLVAVSGGKDSLMLWDVLLELGYRAEGCYIGLGIGEYSDESRALCERFAADRGAALHVVDLVTEYGYDIPTGARAARRATCATCGLSKRYVMNDTAIRLGVDVLATGHNLDDEAAVLFGNLMHWNTDALARQMPVLPAADGFVRKVKPLIRLAERETAAYAVLRGIDYIVEECPMVAGNTGLRYKESLNAIEATSPGTKHQLYFGFLEKGLPAFLDARDRSAEDGEPAVDVHPCERCGAPTTADVCAFCRLQASATDPERVAAAATPVRLGRRRR